MRNSSPIVQNTKNYTLGWGQLNDGGNVNLPVRFANLQLDIVGFLAILGEGAVTSTSQVATLSRMIYLPRFLPAPQALLRTSRPDKLEPASGQTIGVTSGNLRTYVNFLGHILANAESLPDYAVKCIQIKRKHNEGEVKARPYGPTWFVAILGVILSAILFAIALWQEDGMGLLAVLCLSFLSTLVGLANKWKLNLPKRVGKSHWTPPADVIIKYPRGSFVIVQCNEDVARELFFAPEGIEYAVSVQWQYRMIALVGSVVLMFGVIFLGNAGTNTQVAFAVAFMILNAGYWIVAALPQRYHWDTSCFEVIPQAFDEPEPKPMTPQPALDDECLKKSNQEKAEDKKAAKIVPPREKRKPFVSYNKTFTQALWKVIVATREIDWVKKSQAAPDTDAWKDWLQQALQVARDEEEPTYRPQMVKGKEVNVQYYRIPDWDPQKALQRCINDNKHGDLEKADKKTAKIPSDLDKRQSVAEAREMV